MILKKDVGKILNVFLFDKIQQQTYLFQLTVKIGMVSLWCKFVLKRRYKNEYLYFN